MNELVIAKMKQIRIAAIIVGVIGAALSIFGAISNTKQFFIDYLFGYLFWLGLALGCFEILMMHHLTGGRWGFVTRRFYEASAMTIPFLAILFIPLFFGLRELYEWARPAAVAASDVLQHRKAYMNPAGFIGRTIFFFIVWSVFALLLRKWSLQQDGTASVEPTKRMRILSGPGVVLYPLTATFAYIDWIMSLEPDWYSTIFVVILLGGQLLCGFSFAVILLTLLRTRAPFSGVVQPLHFHHLGNLMLTFVMFWTYVAFGQLIIIWSGNLPHEISWYLHRIAGKWKYLLWAIAFFHFFAPFFLLLFRAMKLQPSRLVVIATVLFIVHIADMYWVVVPTFFPNGFAIHWLAFATLFGVGGFWLAAFLTALMRHNLLPANDPRIEFTVAHAH